MANPRWKLSKTVVGRYDGIAFERESDPSDDPEYLAWVHTRPCVASLFFHAGSRRWCRGDMRAHHILAEKPGLALRSRDGRVISLCDGCHTALHEFRGPFEGFSIERIHRFEVAWSDLWNVMHEQERLGAFRRALREQGR